VLVGSKRRDCGDGGGYEVDSGRHNIERKEATLYGGTSARVTSMW